MFRKNDGLTLIEYLVGAAIVVALAGGAMYAVFQKLGSKLNAVNSGL